MAGLAGTGFWVAFAHFQYAALDQGLTAQARLISGGLDVGNGQVNFAGDAPLPAETKYGIAISAFLVNSGGRIIDQSGRNTSYSRSLVNAVRHRGPRGTPFALATANYSDRVLVVPVASGRALLILAQSDGELKQTLGLTAILLAAIIAGLVLANALLGYWVAGRALRPVRTMAATVRDISEHDLGRRLELGLPARDELGELAATFNAMLARLDQAFEGLRRFTADAAHELRAPLTLMRSQLEVILRHERTPADYRASHVVLLAEIERLSRTAEHLLLLARADAGSLIARQLPIDLEDFMEETVSRWQAVAAERGIQIEHNVRPGASLSGDPDLIRRCLDNLVDNALRFTPPGGRVSIVMAEEGPWWALSVTDTGPGVERALVPHVFERFTQADGARTPDDGGAGLGLSLCQAIAVAHGGRITLEPTARGARFVVRVPARPASVSA
jgi:heavy metal sensor kinase